MKTNDVVVLQGGLGNQLFQYFYGKIYIGRTNRKVSFDLGILEGSRESHLGVVRQFKLKELGLDVITTRIISPSEISSLKRVLELKTIPGVFIKFGGISHLLKLVAFQIRSFRLVRLESSSKIRQKQKFSSINSLYLGYWQNAEFYTPHRGEIQSLLANFRSEATKNHLLKARIELGNSVGVHIRRGDYADNPDSLAFHGLLDAEYFSRAIRYYEEEFCVDSVVIFSDDLDWCRRQTFTSLPVFYCDEETTDSLVGKDTLDLMLLSLSKYLVISNSSFSWWAAFLADESAVVVAPANWYADEVANLKSKQIRLNQWVTL